MKYLLLLFLFVSTTVFARKMVLPNEALQLDIGISKHGTDDLTGLILNGEYIKDLRRKVTACFAVVTTLHDGFYPLYFTCPAGENIDGFYRYVTAGVQVAGKIGYSLLKRSGSNLQIKPGLLLRYQSSSYYDQLQVYYPPATSLTVPVIVVINIHGSGPCNRWHFTGELCLQHYA